jgi:hypothetical protein
MEIGGRDGRRRPLRGGRGGCRSGRAERDRKGARERESEREREGRREGRRQGGREAGRKGEREGGVDSNPAMWEGRYLRVEGNWEEGRARRD